MREKGRFDLIFLPYVRTCTGLGALSGLATMYVAMSDPAYAASSLLLRGSAMFGGAAFGAFIGGVCGQFILEITSTPGLVLNFVLSSCAVPLVALLGRALGMYGDSAGVSTGTPERDLDL
ncbi:MAG: hypothetical protein MHM6MM_001469 [Cercozoa sp. M6MM]